jgi:hypothetical protein
MSNTHGSQAMVVMNDYPPDKYIPLIATTVVEASEINKIAVNMVKISPEPKEQDVYVQEWWDKEKTKPKKVALTKKALSKLMGAANIQMISNRPVPTQNCTKCHEMARATRLAPKCYECPYKDDVAVQVAIAVPDVSGSFRVVRATKEIRMADEKAKMTDNQYKQFFPFRTEHAETKALNRALREALMVNSTYEPGELKEKTFVVAYPVPNLDDPEMKRAIIEKYSRGIGDLFGATPQIEAPTGNLQALPGGGSVDTDTGELYEGQPETGNPYAGGQTIEASGHTVDDDEPPPWMRDEAEDRKEKPQGTNIICMQCQRKIEAQGNWTPEVIREYSVKNFRGLVLCTGCQKEHRRAHR